MKIAFDHQIFAEQKVGGISRYHVRLTQHLKSQGEDIKIYSPLYRCSYMGELAADVINGKQAPEWFGKRSALLTMPIQRTIVRKRISSWMPDIIHETYYSPKSLNVHDRSGKRIPTVLTVHDMIHELFPQYFKPWDRAVQHKRNAIEHADHIICVSNATKNDLINFIDIPESKISVIYHGIDTTKEKDEFIIDESRTNMNIKEQPLFSNIDAPYILYVGSRGGHKNFRRLLDAYSSTNSLRSTFILVAFGGGEFSRSERELIHHYRLKPNQVTHVTGDDRVLNELYKKASVLVYPSLYEGFGFPPLEAMVHGCPVVSSSVSSMPEVLGDAARYFDPESIDQMASTIESIVFSSDVMEKLRVAGKSRALMYSWEKCADETVRTYRNLVSK